MIGATLTDRAALAVGRQLANPVGLGGLAVGAIMRLANRRPSRALLKALEIGSEHRLLDIGCGDGSSLHMARGAAWRCGIDRSAVMVKSARRRLRRDIAMARASVQVGDMTRLPFGPGAFDRIMASNMLYFCNDVPAFIDECRRVSRRGGRLGIYVTDRQSMANWRFAGPATHRHFCYDDLRDELYRATLRPEDVAIHPLPLPCGMSGLIAIVRL
nr:class I SAM-dependent methyltransferase [uncultured Sphingomonas sp.]